MEIKKFTEYYSLNESSMQILVLDSVIDDNGNVFNGSLQNDEGEIRTIKGNIERNSSRKITKIIGQDGRSYPAGIDKNGYLSALKIDNDGYILNSNRKKIPIKEDVKKLLRLNISYFRKFRLENGVEIEYDYSNLVSTLPTGWVNVKIDMEVLKRVQRYSKKLGTSLGHQGFLSKLNLLSRISNERLSVVSTKKTSTIQQQMSAVILLHYINEIKDFFHPSSSGFLFESFIAGMIPNSKVREDNSSIDVISGTDTYQIKLLDVIGNKPIKVAFKKVDNKDIALDYYILALKSATKIDIYIINNNGPLDDASWQNCSRQIGNSYFFYPKDIRDMEPITLNLDRIEDKIELIAHDLKKTLGNLYSEISDLQYNVETILVGVDQKGEILNEDSFTNTQTNIGTNLDIIRREVEQLTRNIKNIRRE